MPPSWHEMHKHRMQRPLREADVSPDPIKQFAAWFDAAHAAGLPEPTAMALATATPDGRPSARMVLLKGFDARGFVFYTNYESRKARELDANPQAELLFWWSSLDRQVRIAGSVERISADESDAYFSTRPRESQLGAWASDQSRVLPDRETLDRRFADLAQQYAGRPVPCPPHWGGYRLKPTWFEFWQGRENRLHDRLCYRLVDERNWVIERLGP